MKILFYGVLDTISLAMYEDLAESLKVSHDVAFEFGNVIEKKDIAEKIVTERGFPIGMENPDVMFISDFRTYPRDRNCIVINIGHGLGSKNDYFYQSTPYDSDYFFCSSNWIQRKFRHKKTKFISTGWPKLDHVTKNSTGIKTVLIAPTWNEEYNCLNIIKDNLQDITKEYRVIVKPHEHDKTDWTTYGAEVSHEYNISRLFSECDVVISDVSSVFLEFMSLNRPVIICETDFMRNRKIERPEAHEYFFQNGASYIITKGSQLQEAVEKAMSDNINIRRYINSRRLMSHKGNGTKNVTRLLKKIERRLVKNSL